MHSVIAVDNIQTEVNSWTDVILNENLGVYEMVLAIEADFIVKNDAMKSMDQMRNEMSAQEIEKIEKNGDLIIDAGEEAGLLTLAASQQGKKVYKGSRNLARLTAKARKANRDAEVAEMQLKSEEANAEKDEMECDICPGLQDKVERLKGESKNAVIAAGQIAEQAREDSRNAYDNGNKIKELHTQSDERRGKDVEAVEEVKRRVGRRRSGTSC
ncbi:hypothetical protein BWQ96_06470 [Gracilariopsis chorda]|uniref:Uncharacterized protein n=1 Tax=Gracilariopsis chorda TaxID=448386 RepID=A0A2V3INZ7_9FLOR|nr:hypothetical protein BWQ96_06470 [Gracilariopsis chorda]|eukprot:PXF43777.1 hypothetical protein BWQ96_06470 [Gracilariopsis chorda]